MPAARDSGNTVPLELHRNQSPDIAFSLGKQIQDGLRPEQRHALSARADLVVFACRRPKLFRSAVGRLWAANLGKRPFPFWRGLADCGLTGLGNISGTDVFRAGWCVMIGNGQASPLGELRLLPNLLLENRALPAFRLYGGPT